VLDVTFYGVRGSTPCCDERSVRYGGNTSCVLLQAPDRDPIIFDLGTGLRYFGDVFAAVGIGSVQGHCARDASSLGPRPRPAVLPSAAHAGAHLDIVGTGGERTLSEASVSS
jgi:hypothetical protein